MSTSPMRRLFASLTLSLLLVCSSSALPTSPAAASESPAPSPTAASVMDESASAASPTVAASPTAAAPTAPPEAQPLAGSTARAGNGNSSTPSAASPTSPATVNDFSDTDEPEATAATPPFPVPLPLPVPVPVPAPVPAPIPFPVGHGAEHGGHGNGGGWDEFDEWSDEAVAEAMVDVLHVLFPKPLWTLFVEDEDDEYRDVGEKESDSSDSSSSSGSSSEDSSGEDYWSDWGLMGRRRRDVPQVRDDDEEDHRGVDDQLAWLTMVRKAVRQAGTAKQAGDAPAASHERFVSALRRVFYRARSRVLARGRTAPESPQQVRVELLAMASRALNVSEAEVARAFGDMATRRVGEALLHLLVEDGEDDDEDEPDEDIEDEPWDVNWDVRANQVNGSISLAGDAASPSPSSAPRSGKRTPPQRRARLPGGGGRSGDLDLSPSSVAYFLVELMGTMAGLGWGAVFFGNQAASAVAG